MPTMTTTDRHTPGTLKDAFAVEVRPYFTLRELATKLAGLDEAEAGAALTVLLVLDETFRGDLLSVIRRRHTGFRLTLAALSRSLCLPLSVGDLLARSERLGWHQIVVERDLADACAGTLASMHPGERLVIFWPQWREAALLREALAG